MQDYLTNFYFASLFVTIRVMDPKNLRSDCPLNFALEMLGDKWSLLLVRDMVFGGMTTYKEFLESKEKIATNILAQRLKMLEQADIITKQYDPDRKTKTKQTYVLTDKGVDLIPMMVEMMLWSNKHGQLDDAQSRPVLEKLVQNKDQAIQELRQAVAARTGTQNI